MKKWRVFVHILFATIVLSACGNTVIDEKSTQQDVQRTEEKATITITQQERENVHSTKEVVFREGDTLLNVMNEHFDLTTAFGGMFITGIDGLLADDKQQLTWIFYINDEVAMKGANDLVLSHGDKVEFSLEKWK